MFYSQRVPRTGWVYRNVKNPESVSDHMYRMAMMSLIITDPTVDRDRCCPHTAKIDKYRIPGLFVLAQTNAEKN